MLILAIHPFVYHSKTKKEEIVNGFKRTAFVALILILVLAAMTWTNVNRHFPDVKMEVETVLRNQVLNLEEISLRNNVTVIDVIDQPVAIGGFVLQIRPPGLSGEQKEESFENAIAKMLTVKAAANRIEKVYIIIQEKPFAITGQQCLYVKETKGPKKMSVSAIGYSPHFEVEIVVICEITSCDGNLPGSLNDNLGTYKIANDVTRICTEIIGQQDPEVVYIGDSLLLIVA